jgi:predicted adenine nucleotide alpha hydrolase (AANH) superfamily ATPase
LLIHICCSVDSHYFIKKIIEKFPDKKITAFFYNPNIHPYSEYLLRFNDVKRSCDKYNIKLIDGNYDLESWLNAVKGYEDEPEKGLRCNICFENRFENSAKIAKELNIEEFTSTLLMSPKKSIEQLTSNGQKVAKKYNLNFISVDFRKSGGTQEQFKIAKDDKLYHQNYCGCMFALKQQRKIQNKIDVELFKNISNQCEPNSIEEKIELYKQVEECEKNNQQFELIRVNFKNYRLLLGSISIDKEVIPSHILRFSYLKKEYSKTKIKFSKNKIFYTKKDNIKIIKLSQVNKLLKTDKKDIKELIKKPLNINDEIKLRNFIDNVDYSCSIIIIIDDNMILDENSIIEIKLKSIIYDDVKEVLVNF